MIPRVGRQPGHSPVRDPGCDPEVRLLGPRTQLYLTLIGRSGPDRTSASSRCFWPLSHWGLGALIGGCYKCHDGLPCSKRVPERDEDTDAREAQSQEMKGSWGLRQASTYWAGHQVTGFPKHNTSHSPELVAFI